jgi:predicted nuclease of restriction endonuclease-like (RecB) superfamily
MSNSKDLPAYSGYDSLIEDIGELLHNARAKIATSVNTILVQTYWNIGKCIVEYEQNGAERATYGDNLLNRLSSDLSLRYGKGFGRSNVYNMRKLYLSYPKIQTLSGFLSWSHYSEILKSDDPLEMSFYAKECEMQKWSVRELKRQRKSMLFHRFALSKNKDGVLQLAQDGIEIQKPEDIIHDPYVLEFVGLPNLPVWDEKSLEDALANNLSMFMLELGKGFSFVRKQYHIPLEGRHFYVDLVFYNIILKTYCLIDLKKEEVRHEDIGQMNLYLNYFKHEVCSESDNEPFGIVLGANKSRLTVQYALEGITNQLFVSRYQFYLPDRDALSREVFRIIEAHAKENRKSHSSIVI